MAYRIRTGDPCGFNKGRNSKFHEGSQVRETPEEGWRPYRPKRCGNNNRDEDNSLKTLNDKNLKRKIIFHFSKKFPLFIEWGSDLIQFLKKMCHLIIQTSFWLTFSFLLFLSLFFDFELSNFYQVQAAFDQVLFSHFSCFLFKETFIQCLIAVTLFVKLSNMSMG